MTSFHQMTRLSSLSLSNLTSTFMLYGQGLVPLFNDFGLMSMMLICMKNIGIKGSVTAFCSKIVVDETFHKC